MITVTQASGASVKFTPTTTWSGDNGICAFWVQGLPPGNYAFTATGTDVSGNKAILTQNLTIVPDPVCPVCPPPPVVLGSSIPVASWSVVMVNGVGRIQIQYKDGSVALLP